MSSTKINTILPKGDGGDGERVGGVANSCFHDNILEICSLD